jgi:hypothetical protein
MSALNEPVAKRISKLIRMFGSSFENERHVALTKLKCLLDEEGLTFNDVAIVIENCDGEIEERKYSDSDLAYAADRMKKKGEQEGYQKARREMMAPPEFYDDFGNPRWYEIAVHCRANKGRLHRDWDKTFVEDLPGKILSYGEPTPPQAKQLLRIFLVLGGVVDPKVAKTYS